MNKFLIDLKKKVAQSKKNNFGLENYDEYRYGKYTPPKTFVEAPVHFLKQIVKRLIGYESIKLEKWIDGHEEGLMTVYEKLNKSGQELLIDLIAFRFLGYRHVKLKRNNKEYWNAIDSGNSMADKNDTYDPHFMGIVLDKIDLNPLGYDIKFYFTGYAVAIDFILEQYAYKNEGKTIVDVAQGDVVIDAGACWGDTALYFAHKTGSLGRVYSFEFIPDNIKLFNVNRSLNPHLADRMKLVEHPLSHTSDINIYYKDNGPGSRVAFNPFDTQTGTTTTISIDDFVKSNNIEKVDFIKMDIEGAETSALNGAMETIKRFKPKLAIAIYHSLVDMYKIPELILSLNLGYEIFIDHFTLHEEETVCYAKIMNTV